MAFRTTALLQVQSNTKPQPLIGSWITAGIGGPASQPITVTLGSAAVGSSVAYDAEALFRSGDPVWLLNPDGTGGEPAQISALPGGNRVTLGQQQGSPQGVNNPVTLNSHVSGAFGVGTFILLHQLVNNFFVQAEDGNAGTFLYIGDAYNFTATWRRIAKLAKVGTGQQPYSYNAAEYSALNPFLTSELWILGGTGVNADGYTPTACVI